MKRVALIYNLRRNESNPGLPADFYSEFDSEDTIRAIANALKEGGNEVVPIEANGDFLEYVFKNKEKIDIVFNIAEGQYGQSRESRVPAILDYLGIPYTGSGVLSLSLALDKAVSKKIFRHEGIPTPNFQLFKSHADVLEKLLEFPLIVKPNCEGSAKGISAASVVYNKVQLYEQLERTLERYNQDVLVEEFIDGAELTVGILGNNDLSILPILEIDFSNCVKSGEYFYSWRMKEYQGDVSQHLAPSFYCPARLDEATAKRVKEVARRAHEVLGCSDFSRTDIRLSKNGTPYVLEVNPLAGLHPTDSNFTYIAKSSGIGHAELINTILELAINRHKHNDAPHPASLKTILNNVAGCGVKFAQGSGDTKENDLRRTLDSASRGLI